MKYLVISDIHGDEAFSNYMFHLVDIEHPDSIILLGDLRSFMGHNERIDEFVNRYKERLILILGNNDRQGTYDIPFNQIFRITIGNKVFLFTHGHLCRFTDFDDVDVFVSGHTHECMLENVGNIIRFNPGSISFPRGGTPNSYGTIDDESIALKDIDGNDIKRLKYNCINH